MASGAQKSEGSMALDIQRHCTQKENSDDGQRPCTCAFQVFAQNR